MNKIAVISMVRNEQDIIESFVRHSLCFADVILIMNHNSTDKTGEILSQLEKEGLPVIVQSFVQVEHAQAEVMDMLLQEAVEKYQSDIILPLDADEFLVNTETEASCREILQRLSPQDVYRLRWRTYIPSSDEGEKATFIPWRTVQRNQQDDAGNKVILGAAVYRRQCCRIAQGNHYAYTGPAEKPRRLQDREIPMLHLAHFPWRSHEQYASKVSSGWLNNIAKYSRHTSIATHYQKYFHQLEAGKEIGPEDFVQNPEPFSLQRYVENQELRYTPSGKVPVLQNLLATGVDIAQAFLEEKVRQEASLVTVLAADGGDATEWQAMRENIQAQTWPDIEIVRWASNMSREELSRKVHGKYIQWLLPGERMQPARIARLAASLAVNLDVDAVVTEIRADGTNQEGCVDLSFLPKDELVVLDGKKVAAYMEKEQGFLADKRFASFFCRREVMEECGWLPQEVAAVLRQPDARQTMLSLWQRALRPAASLGLLRVCYLKPVRDDLTQRYQMARMKSCLFEGEITDTKIHVCYAMHDADGHYAKFIGTSMCSILENTKRQIAVHILHDDTLTAGNREKFLQLAQRYGAEISFYDVIAEQGPVLERAYAALSEVWLRYYSRAVLYRFFIWRLLPQSVGRAIYLDTDIIVQMDIEELWQQSTGSAGLAAINDIAIQHAPESYNLIRDGFFAAERYFNSGVLLMDRETFGAEDSWIEKAVEFFRAYPSADFPDQDVMNYFFINRYEQLPYRYNQLVEWERLQGHPCTEGIYHFNGHVINFDFKDAFTRMYFHYFMKTPWADERFLERFYGVVQSTYAHCTHILQECMNNLAGKKRVAVYEPEFTPAVAKAFRMRKGEELIPCEDIFAQREEFAQALKQLQDTYIFLFFSQQYPQLGNSLKQLGLQEGENYMDGRILLQQNENGYKMDEYQTWRTL